MYEIRSVRVMLRLPHAWPVPLRGVAAVHLPQDLVVARLERDVEVLANGGHVLKQKEKPFDKPFRAEINSTRPCRLKKTSRKRLYETGRVKP